MLNSLSSEELEFIKAVEDYKAKNGKLFPSWTEIMKVFKELGYRKVGPRPSEVSPKKEGAKN